MGDAMFPVVSPKSKIALITGVTGQTGSFLADLLLAKGEHPLSV